MTTAVLPQLQPQSSVPSPTYDDTPTEAPSGLLSRTWVPPPRPKPGRKPATDTPPSKRKAQNRLAQRNFRERRAAKVNELEDQMREVQADHDAEIDELNAAAKQLKNHLALLESTLQADRTTLHAVQTELDRERSLRQALETKLARAEEELKKAGVVPLTRRRPVERDQVNERASTSMCDKCTLHKCSCLDALDKAESMQGLDAMKRPSSPDNDSSSSKRPRIDPLVTSNMAMEIDLTTRPKLDSRTLPVEPHNVLATSGIPIDSCGFCDNNPDVCLCRGKDNETIDQAEPEVSNITNALSATRAYGCTGRPGSCKQCQDDPRSARFCKSFARTRSPPLRPSGKAGGPGGCGVANCCQNQKVQQRTSHMRTGSLSEKLSSLSTSVGGNAGGSTLDCAAVYRKLQGHPKFDEAMTHVDDWTPRLRPPIMERPELVRKQSLEGRTPYEIEAASVMSTLKYFDSKFGSDPRGDWRHQS